MMRKFTTYLFICTLCCCIGACDDDEVSAPPMPSFTVDKTSGMANETEFTFVIDEVDADAVTLLPYGVENGGKAGILVKTFTSGKATVKVTYNDVGVFNAVVVASNFANDGESIERSTSNPVAVTITSHRNSFTAFNIATSDSVLIDTTARTIDVYMPYGTDVTALKPTFTASPFTTVTVGGAEQTSGTSVVNFTNPVTYRITADNGTTRDYTVTVISQDPENVNTVKSFSGKEVSKGANNRTMGSFVGDGIIVLYDTLNTPVNRFDSVCVGYELTGAFATLLFGGEELEQDSLLDLTGAKALVVDPQDPNGASKNYTLYSARAPKLTLAFTDLNPEVQATTQNFAINAIVLKGTNLASIGTTASVALPPNVLVTSITADGNLVVEGVETPVNYTKPVKFVLNVTDTVRNISYQVTYTATVTVTP
ncbi:MAG TPA: hypothetical protein VEB86_05240 [Chryseosolibacter sp.]|nr:hypothetical protein [Chryseosolibacter sp.]